MPSSVNTQTQAISGYDYGQQLPDGVTNASNTTYSGTNTFTGDIVVGGVTLYDNTYAIGGIEKVVAIPFGATELSGSEVNTSFSFPTNGAIATAAWIYVADSESGTIQVGTQGTSNDPNGLLDAISVASTGYVFPTATITTGLNGTYISATTFGALTHLIDLGTDDDGDSGFIIPRGVFITGGDPVSITSSGDLNSCSGTLFIKYIELPSVA